MTTATPIDPALATWDDDEPRLVGGRCGACGTVAFPRIDGCPRCGSDDVAAQPLGRRGTLWTWTTQGFLPKRPYVGVETDETFTPYLLGYVELAEGVMVEGWLLDVTPETARIGCAMELTTFAMPTIDARGEVLTFGFRPCEEVAA